MGDVLSVGSPASFPSPLRGTPPSMKRFPFAMLFVCVFLPPICYLITIKALEAYFDNRERSHLNDILIRDYEAVIEGR